MIIEKEISINLLKAAICNLYIEEDQNGLVLKRKMKIFSL